MRRRATSSTVSAHSLPAAYTACAAISGAPDESGSSRLGADGQRDHGGVKLRVAEARGRTYGDRVLVLIRPESLELTASANGSTPQGNTVSGDVITHTLLGPVTRVKVAGPAGNLIADMPTALPVGSRVVANVPDEGLRLLTLPREGTPAPDEDDQ